MLHHACLVGNLEFVEFIIDVAGPENLNVLSLIINAKDHIGQTPLFLLCEKGYSSDELRPLEHANRRQMLELLIPKELPTGDPNKAEWTFICD